MKYKLLPTKEIIDSVSTALKARGIEPHYTENKADALALLKQMIPDGAEIMTGASVTLDEIGFTELLVSGSHSWQNWKDQILAEKDFSKQIALRKQSASSEYFLGSVHAVTEDGHIIIASASGSQFPSIAFSSDNVIFVVGTQKIVSTLEDGLKRINEYVLPLEDQRMKDLGYPGSGVAKLLIIEREMMPNRKLQLVFINEILGF